MGPVADEACANPRPPEAELTIPHRLVAAARRWPDQTALEWEGGSWTFAELQRRVLRAAAGLEGRGVGPGARVAIFAPNHPATLVNWLASNWLGATAALLNPELTPGERAQVLEHAQPVLVLEAEQGLEPEQGLEGPDGWRRDPAPAPRDPAVLLYTSGTTGRPKGVLQSHLTYALTGEAFARWVGLTRQDRLMGVLPLFHINAQAYAFMTTLSHGLPLALVPRFSVSRFWAWVERFRATQVNLLGAMLMLLLKDSRPPGEHSLRLIYTAPALPEPAHRAVESRFGVRLVVGYGLSECTFGAVVPPGTPRPGSMGLPRSLPEWGYGSRLEVVDARGREAAAGEIRLQNAAVFLGYHRDAQATARALRGGWLYTGDLARRDAQGHLYFLGRADDVIRRRGENIAPREVEEALLAHPAVREAAVVGVPSPLTEEDVKAYVCLDPGARVSGEELFGWCATRLARHKVPRFLEVVTALPHTPTGRVAKGRLLGPDAPRGQLYDRG